MAHFRRAMLHAAMFLAASITSHTAEAQLLTSIASAAGTEDGQTTSIAAHKDWRVECKGPSGKTACRISTTSLPPEGDGRQLSVELTGEQSSAGSPLFYFLVPLDLLVAQGVEVRFTGGAPMKLAYRSCHPAGCLIPFQMGKELEKRFRKESRLTLRLFDLNAKPFDVTISLAGFSAAIDAIGL